MSQIPASSQFCLPISQNLFSIFNTFLSYLSKRGALYLTSAFLLLFLSGQMALDKLDKEADDIITSNSSTNSLK